MLCGRRCISTVAKENALARLVSRVKYMIANVVDLGDPNAIIKHANVKFFEEGSGMERRVLVPFIHLGWKPV